MPKENFLLVSLEELQAKQLADVLSNDTSRRIINYLSEHEDATETELSQQLLLPLPTVHYNLHKLKEAQLVHVEEFHYSKKGREVDHYKLANRYVIITPKPVKGIKTALRGILPVGAVIVGIGIILQLMQRASLFAGKAAQEISTVAEINAVHDSTPAVKRAAQVLTETALTTQVFPGAGWFILGGIIALLLMILYRLWRMRT